MAEAMFHPFTPVCPRCEQAVRLERLAFTASGQMEVLGTCSASHLVRVEMHVVEAVAKAASLDKRQLHSALTPLGVVA